MIIVYHYPLPAFYLIMPFAAKQRCIGKSGHSYEVYMKKNEKISLIE